MNELTDKIQTRSKTGTDFSSFDNERVAVILTQNAIEFVFKGLAAFERYDQLGRILRVCADDPADGDFILAEATWEGRVIPDLQHGCRFCFMPGSRK